MDNLFGLKVDVKELLKEAGEIEKKMGTLVDQMKKGKQPVLEQTNEELPMYG